MLEMNDSFKTISKPAEARYTVRNSKFIGFARRMENREQLNQILDEIKGVHPKATHYCFAYRLYPDGAVVRVNDDGEPKGSAGKPILNAIFSNGITNVIVVVVRYYGGKNLGIPGLIDAYKTSAQMAIEASGVISKKVLKQLTISIPFAHYARFMQFLKDQNISLLSQETLTASSEMQLEFEPKKIALLFAELESLGIKI